MTTTLYLIRHGATEANLVQPYRLQGRCSNAGLAPLGVRQAELTRDVLKDRAVSHIFSSPLKRAVQTAKIIAAPHKLPVKVVDDLTECDVGQWEGLTWETIREMNPEVYEHFLENPAVHGYPGGETFTQVAERALPIFHRLLEQHAGETQLIVGHHVVNRIYLSGLLGLPLSRARQVKLDNCGLSVVEHEGGQSRVAILNSIVHLQGIDVAA